MADPVAIISVVSGAVVAISVPLITSGLERRRLHEQVGEARLDELRSVLDEAAVALDRAFRTLPTSMVLLKALQTDDENEMAKRRLALYEESEDAIEAVGTQAERLGVRLSEASSAYVGYDRARRRLTVLRTHLMAAAEGEESQEIGDTRITLLPVDPDTDAEFTEARRQFRQAASELVGPDLSLVDRRRVSG